MTRTIRALALAPLLALGATAPSLAQSGPILRVNAAEITLNGRVQTQFATTDVDGQPESEIFLRRVRLEVTVRANRVVSGKLAPDFAGDRVTMKDAYLKLDFSPAVQLLAGKAYRPFSLIEQTSSVRILPIERGLVIRGLGSLDELGIIHVLGYADRDVGLQVMGSPAGAPLGLGYAAGVFSGPFDRLTGDEATYQYVARATARPLGGVTVGAAWSNRAFADSIGGSVIERGNAFEADIEIGTYAPGFHAVGEITRGDFDPVENAEFRGAQGWVAYRTNPLSDAISAVEPLFRASYSDIDGREAERGGTLLTPGINVYLGGLNRVMVNYDVWMPAGGGSTHRSFKTQFQLAF